MLLFAALVVAGLDRMALAPSPLAFMVGGICTLALPLVVLARGREQLARLPGRAVEITTLCLLGLGPVAPVVVGRGAAVFELDGVVLASVFGLAVLGAVGVRTVLRRIAFDRVSVLASTVALVGLSVWLTWSEGTLIKIRDGTAGQHLMLYAVAAGSCPALVLPWAAGLYGPRPRPRALSPVAGIAMLAAAALALYADRTRQVGLYPAAHVWLECIAVVSLAAGLGSLLPSSLTTGRGRSLVITIAYAGSVVLACLSPAPASDLLFRSEVAAGPVGRHLLRLRPLRVDSEVDTAALVPVDRMHGVPPPRTDLDIILVTIDTLRADALPMMPNLSALAAEGSGFSRAYAPAPMTNLSMPAILSGRNVSELDWGFWLVPRTGEPALRLGEASREDRLLLDFFVLADAPPGGWLAERLEARGFATLAIADGGVSEFFRPATGFSAGFSYYDFRRADSPWPSSDGIVDQALARLDETSGRTFLWLHLFDPHRAERERAAYDELVPQTDDAVGRLIAGLKKRGRYERTAIVVTADHGEAFGEHGHRGHGSSLFEEQVAVPLVIRVPGVEPRPITDPVSAIDVAPTLANLGGADTSGMTGVNLLPAIVEGNYPRRRPIFIEHLFYGPHTQRRRADLKGVVIGQHKLVWDRRAETIALFDLGVDPREEDSRLREDETLARELQAILQAHALGNEAKHPPP